MKHVKFLVGILTLTLLTACINKPIKCTGEDEDCQLEQHMLMVGDDGNLGSVIELSQLKRRNEMSRDSYLRSNESERLNDIVTGLKTHMRDCKRSLDTPERCRIQVYIHGGLQHRRNSVIKAADLIAAGEMSKGGYPIFVNWRSGPFDTYGDHLTRVRQGTISKSAKWFSWLYLLTDAGKAVVGAPQSWLVQGKHSIDSIVKKRLRTVDGDRELLPEFVTIVDADQQYDCNSDRGSRNKRKALWALTIPSKLITAPIVTEFGQGAWDVMRRRTHTLFWTTDELQRLNSDNNGSGDELICKPNDIGDGGLSRLLENLIELDDEYVFSITLIGHSMGAIVANRIIERAPQLDFDKIVHMASADSIESTWENTIHYLINKEQISEYNGDRVEPQFYNLMLHSDNENRELHLSGLAPSGSLLAWIDNMYTIPPSIWARTSGRWSNVRNVVHLVPPEIVDRVHFTIFSRDQPGQPQEHGDFDECDFWQEKFWTGQ